MKLSSLKDLKVIKKDLVPEPEARPAGNQPRSKTVVHRSKEEEKARSEGLAKGQKVRMMDSSDGIPEWAALDFQMNYFRQVLRQNIKHEGRRIVFIHGVGDGILAQAIRKELDEVFALSCSYTYGPMGATNVTVK